VPSGSSPVGGGRPPAAVVIKQWTPVLDLRLALGAPLAGALVGLLAGLYPSLRAARMEPVDALRAPS
jgi:putative ABC transport system permease protein